MEMPSGIYRWIHIMAGVMWIGLLYYFNFVQVAALKAAQADSTAAGITKACGAACTVPSSAGRRWQPGWPALRAGLQFRRGIHASAGFPEESALAPGLAPSCCSMSGLIWPNQKKILGLVQATDEQKKQGAAGGFSRIPHQHRIVDSDAVLHGGADAYPDVGAIAVRRNARATSPGISYCACGSSFKSFDAISSLDTLLSEPTRFISSA